jgi:phosphatidylserine decarboxylase
VQSVDRDVPLPLELQDCPAAFEGRFIRVSIFLSVFNVHVNRIPVSGIVKKMIYCPGKFINASLDKASSDNERQYVSVETGKGEVVHFTQIAGLIARRIVCNLEEGQNVVRGERFGIIRFGSKMDIYLPANYKVQVLEGQIVIGGETILAEMRVTGDE